MIKIGEMFFPDKEISFQKVPSPITDYQRPQREAAFGFVTDWRLAVDVGANVGIFSRHFAERFDEVLAIEPLIDNIECLLQNVPANVRIRRVAVGDRHGDATIYLTPKSLGGAFVCDHDDVVSTFDTLRDDLKEGVEMVTIDSLDLPHVGLMKIDIQGSEAIALRGARETLKRCRPVVMIEEKHTGGDTRHIEESRAILLDCGMTMKDRVGADRIYVYE